MHKLHSKHLKTKSKFRARIRRIRSLSPSKIVTTSPSDWTNTQDTSTKAINCTPRIPNAKERSMIFNVYMHVCIMCVCVLMRISRSDKEVRVLQFWCVNSSGLAATPQAEHSPNETWQTWHWSCCNNNLFCISSQNLLQQQTKSTCQPHLQKQLQVFDLLLQFCDFSSDARELQLFHEKHPRTYIDLTTKMFRLFERVTKFSQVLAWTMCMTL